MSKTLKKWDTVRISFEVLQKVRKLIGRKHSKGEKASISKWIESAIDEKMGKENCL